MAIIATSTKTAIQTVLDGTNNLYGISLNEAKAVKEATSAQPDPVDVGISVSK